MKREKLEEIYGIGLELEMSIWTHIFQSIEVDREIYLF